MEGKEARLVLTHRWREPLPHVSNQPLSLGRAVVSPTQHCSLRQRYHTLCIVRHCGRRSSSCPPAGPIASHYSGLSHSHCCFPRHFRYLWFRLCNRSPAFHHCSLTLQSQGFLKQKLFLIFKINFLSPSSSISILCSRKDCEQHDVKTTLSKQ